MKVCTDSCLFGSWISTKIEQEIIAPKTILDIGSGTGLLGLIIAQKSAARIDAIEIDEDAFQETFENFRESLWSKQLQVYHGDIKNWESKLKYDLIISNPPFFENDLKANEQNKNVAKHDDALTFIQLLLAIKNTLAPNGNFAVLLPFHRVEYFTNLAAENDFYLEEKILLKQTPKHPYFRGMLFFGSNTITTISKEIIIKDQKENYTAEFEALLRDYYLAFI